MFNFNDIKEADVVKYLTGGKGNYFAVYEDGSTEVQGSDGWREWEYDIMRMAIVACPDSNAILEAELAEWVGYGILAPRNGGKYEVIEATPDEGLVLDRSAVLEYMLTHGSASNYESGLKSQLKFSVAE